MKRIIRNYHYKDEKIKEEKARVRWEIGGEIDKDYNWDFANKTKVNEDKGHEND